MTLDGEYCICAMAEEDPLHYGWHRIYMWNLSIFGKETIRRSKVFDAAYGHEFKPEPEENPTGSLFSEAPF